MRSRLLFCILFFYGIIIHAMAQAPQLVSVARPSPNVQAMQKYGDIPVSAYTGVPSISVPIYTVSFRDITIPISLSYHASGIKVSEEASQVGLGWALNAGGSISRNIIGGDDFDGSKYFNTSISNFADGLGPTAVFQIGCTAQMFNKNPGQPTISNYDMTSFLNGSPPSDFQPDQYFFNFLDRSGKFITRRDKTVILQKQEKLQITCMATDGSAWQIKGLDGTTYDFTQYETYTDNVNNFVHKSAWHLTKITSPSGNKVTFNYTVLPNRFIQSIGSYSMSRDDFDSYIEAFRSFHTPPQAGVTPGQQYSMVLLSSIDFTNGLVQFNYSDNRPDLGGDKRLDSVTVFARDARGNINANPFKTVVLSYDFFNYSDFDDDFGTGTDNNAKRLKLMAVQQKGTNGGQLTVDSPYRFSYFEGSTATNLPSKASFARDHWGYYNGKTSNTTLIPSFVNLNTDDAVSALIGLQGPERDPDTTYVKAFTLQSIRYPTGGSTEFQYEANDFDEQRSLVNDQSYFNHSYDIVQKTATLAFNGQTGQYITTDTFNLTDEYINFNNGGTANVTLSSIFRFDGTVNCSNITYSGHGYMYVELYDSTGTNLLFHIDPFDLNDCSGTSPGVACRSCASVVLQISNALIDVPAGKYIWKAFVSGSSYGAHVEDIQTTLTWYTQVTSLPTHNPSSLNYYFAGGLRIKRIIDHDGINPDNDKVKKYMYHYNAIDSNGVLQEYSYGRRMSRPNYSYFEPSLEEKEIQLTLGKIIGSGYAEHLMRVSDSDIPLNGSALGSVVGYDQVTELLGENGENGKTVYQYINQPDYVLAFNINLFGDAPGRPPYSSNIPEPLNGSLLNQTDYANIGGNFVPVKSVTNIYETVIQSENDAYGMEMRIFPVNKYDETSYLGPDELPCSRELCFYNTLRSDWTRVDTMKQRLYNKADTTQFLETITSYQYNNPAHLLPTATTAVNSKGQSVITNISYPLDYTDTSATDAFTKGIAHLQNVHVVNAPIEKYSKKNNSNGTTIGTTSAVLTNYDLSLPLPDLIYQTEAAGPITSFSPAATSAEGPSKDPNYQPLIYIDRYDSNGNVLQQHKLADVVHSYIWDYHNSFPIAEVTNASQIDIAYTSFESNGSGNWTIGSATRIAGGITGDSSYELSNGSINKSGLTGSTSYIVSYWTQNNGAFSISGTVTGYPIKGKTATINNVTWTYFEHKITGVTSISLSGSGPIDELRIYPTTAQMKTYTFTPLVGMTSQVDPASRITYYEYDGLARLKRVRDQDNNILKTFDYQYQVSSGCGTGCYTVPLQTWLGTATIGYPVGVFNVHGKLLGNATGPVQYVTLWNSDTADNHLGALATGNDSLHFSLTLDSGRSVPGGVTGLRYYQVDLPSDTLDGIRNVNGAYVDFGDGSGMSLGKTYTDTPTYIAPNTQLVVNGRFLYFRHTYPNTSLKTLTLYHNDGQEISWFDNGFIPERGLDKLTHFRGNLPMQDTAIGGSCYRQLSMNSIDSIWNWNAIKTIRLFEMNSGDLLTAAKNLNYKQDFLLNNLGLNQIRTARGLRVSSYLDTTFKLNKLKSNWNTYFTELGTIVIMDDHWNHEDLSGLKKLWQFHLVASTQDHMDGATSPFTLITSTVIDNIINQIASGSGQTVSNGFIIIQTGGLSTRSSNSDAAYNFLVSKGWTFILE